MTTAFAQISAALTALGPRLDCESVVAYDAERIWFVTLDADHRLELVLDEGLALLHIAADLGVGLGEADMELAKTLLAYNCLFRETGGLRLGYEPQRATLRLVVSAAVTTLDEENLAALFESIAKKTDDWRALLTTGNVGDEQNRSSAEGAWLLKA